MDIKDVVVIGAGPGGLGAAIEAARAGARVTLLDENAAPGGQIFRRPEKGIEPTGLLRPGSNARKGRRLEAEFRSLEECIDYRPGVQVWGLFDRCVAYHHEGASHRLGFKRLVISPGAWERPVPFPGWTLPGVFMAGGAQRFIKTQGVLPGERFLLAGSGPLLLQVAYEVLTAQGQVSAILEAGRRPPAAALLHGLVCNPDLLMDAAAYLTHILAAGVALRRSHIIVAAEGRERVEAAVIARVDADWRPIAGTYRTVPVDTVLLGYGFVPSAQLTRLAGCTHEYNPFLGGWIACRGADMQTSVKGVYATGDGAGVAGGPAAQAEGRIAGVALAHSLGLVSAAEALRRRSKLQTRLRRIGVLRKVLDDVSRPRPGLFELAREDTPICRCEEITLGRIKQCLADGASDINEVKRMTRTGMGRCQGRMCTPWLRGFMAAGEGPDTGEAAGFMRLRPPVKPVPLHILANSGDRG